MAECTVCGVGASASDGCPHCARPVCADHRAPGAHDCPGVDADRTGGWFTDPDAGRSRQTGSGAVPALSNPRRLAAGVLLVAVLAVVATAAFAATGLPSADLDGERVARLVADGANDARIDRGLDALAWNASLAALAGSHSADMAAGEYVNHTRPDGTTVADRYAAAGLDCGGGENIYYTPNGALQVSERALADVVVRSWLRSEGHRETLLAGGFRSQGVGVVVAPDGGVYVTQNVC